jgi:PPM family protein phosphatase
VTDGVITLRAVGRSDPGRARERNEDSYYAGSIVFAVADGLGGHRAGEVASSIAIEPISALEQGSAEHAASALVEAVREANREIYERARHDTELRGMATTLTALAFHDGTAHLAHVGDSRCYLIREDRIVQLSQDHTLVERMRQEGKLTTEQAEMHPQRSVVTRALGAEPDVDVDETQWTLMQGDLLLLCSDGLTSVVDDEEIRDIVRSTEDLDELCRELINEANARGGPDNITVVTVRVEGDEQQAVAATPAERRRREKAPRRRRMPRRVLVWTMVVLIVFGGGFLAMRVWANRSFFVGVQRGKVAVFRGLPTEVFGWRMARIERVTPTPLSDVAPYFRGRLHDGITAKSLRDGLHKALTVPLTTEARIRREAAAKAAAAASAAPSPTARGTP